MQLAFTEQYVVEEKRSATRLVKTVYRVKVGVKQQQRWSVTNKPVNFESLRGYKLGQQVLGEKICTVHNNHTET